jgi:hypothetical protein
MCLLFRSCELTPSATPREDAQAGAPSRGGMSQSQEWQLPGQRRLVHSWLRFP